MLRSAGLTSTCQRIIELLLLLTVIIVPLIFIPVTSELFEFNKMYLVHAAAWLILACELIKLFSTPKPTVNVPPLVKTGLFFLAVMALATIWSIDQHVSWFGYYNRWNGGLWSLFSYAVIFYAAAGLTKEKFRALIKASLAAAVVVGIWGCLEHFGHSPSCLILSGSFDDGCWAQDVKARVFATLGQPNWLAAYLAMIWPWLVYYYLKAQARWEQLGLGLGATLTFAGFVFTYSRGGSFGLAAAVVVLLILLGWKLWRITWSKLLLLATSCAVVAILFASPLTGTLFGSPPHREIGTLETGDETGNIRLIVWSGTWQIFYHHPLLGTGLETFGESFNQFRPLEMNYNPEWNFIFNKAHNEYLNYLATTGALGLLAYLLLLGSFTRQALRPVITGHSDRLVAIAALASSAGFLVQNIFSFTVVPLAVLMVLNLATLGFFKPRRFSWSWPREIMPFIKRRGALLLVIPAAIGLIIILNIWRADPIYKIGTSYLNSGETGQALQALTEANHLFPSEPLYQMELAQAYADQAVADSKVQNVDSLVNSATKLADQATAISPDELTLRRKQGTIDEELYQIKPEFGARTIAVRELERRLAPSDPSVLVELGHIYLVMGNLDAAATAYEEAAQLKTNYLDPYVALTHIYLQQGKIDAAKKALAQAQQIDPTNQDVVELSQEAQLK